MTDDSASDRVGGQMYREAQARRLKRFLKDEKGIVLKTFDNYPSDVDISAILDADGKIVPEPQDYARG